MTHGDLQRLLSGYAFGTLTQDERGELLRAALTDQALFDALADEEALRDLLADPQARRELLAQLAPDGTARATRWNWAWMRWPAAGLAAAALLTGVYLTQFRKHVAVAPPVEIAMNKTMPAVEPQPGPQPEPARQRVLKSPPPVLRDEKREMAKDADKPAAPPPPAAPAVVFRQSEQVAKSSTPAPPLPRAVAEAKQDNVIEEKEKDRRNEPAKPAGSGVALVSAEVSARAAKKAVQTIPLVCVLEKLTGEGAWESVPTGASVDSAARLRLAFESPEAGVLEVPGVARPVPVAASEKTYVALPTQTAGAKVLRVHFRPGDASVEIRFVVR